METTPRWQLTAMDRAVDLGFAILLIVCGLRYFDRHELEGTGVFALLLAIGTGLSYAIAALGSAAKDPALYPAENSQVSMRPRLGVILATAFWLPLTVIAPSFGWCGFALFFAVHRVLRGRLAILVSVAIVLAVSTGLFLMSKGDDIGLVLGPFFGGLVLAYVYAALDRSHREQQQLIDELITTREQLAQFEREAGALSERERVASELHDTVVQRTATALLLLESEELRAGQQSRAVGEASEELREALVETRQLLHGLADPRKENISLPSALEALAIDAGAVFVCIGEQHQVPETITHALQRVTREALINIAKHARASSSRVTLTFFESAVGVDIADDGIGFDGPPPAGVQAESDANGFGIRAMTWRIESLGGELTVETHPGEGTVVSAIVPFTPADSEAREFTS